MASSRTRSVERGVRWQAFGKASTHPAARLASAGGEHLLDEVVAADGLDGGQEARGEPVVVAREEVLGLGRDVVQVARPADTVAFGPAHHELGGLERPELLEDARPARAEPGGELVRRGRPELAEQDDDVPAEGRRRVVAVRARVGPRGGQR